MPPNNEPLICFGQDECIFKQYLFTGKAWTMPDGQKPIIPKDEGLGVIFSRGPAKSKRVQSKQKL
jgi:hypothetical protein